MKKRRTAPKKRRAPARTEILVNLHPGAGEATLVAAGDRVALTIGGTGVVRDRRDDPAIAAALLPYQTIADRARLLAAEIRRTPFTAGASIVGLMRRLDALEAALMEVPA